MPRDARTNDSRHPYHLRTLAHVGAELELEVEGQATQRSLLDALEARCPMLRGMKPEIDHQKVFIALARLPADSLAAAQGCDMATVNDLE